MRHVKGMPHIFSRPCIRTMPRRRSQGAELPRDDESIDVSFTFRSRNGPVGDHLKNQFYDLLVKSGEPLECPVCLESVLGCRNCFCLLVCGHAMHLHEYLKLSKCPVCRE